MFESIRPDTAGQQEPGAVRAGVDGPFDRTQHLGYLLPLVEKDGARFGGEHRVRRGAHGRSLSRVAVLAAYGWDLDPEIGHHRTKIGTRWTVGPRARFELLDLLLEENHRRHAAL